MNIPINYDDELSIYSDENEIKAAVNLLCGRCCNACESPPEYAGRKRKTDMAKLLDIAIKNELTDRERSVTNDYWFGGLSCSAIASKLGISHTSVYEAKKRAEDKLRRVLRYVRIYQDELSCFPDEELLLAEPAVISRAARNAGESLNENLKNERLRRALPTSMVEKFTGIKRKRIIDIESGKVTPDAIELKTLCTAYRVSPNEIYGMKGLTNEQKS